MVQEPRGGQDAFQKVYQVHTVFTVIFKCDLPSSLSFSPKCIVLFSRGCVVCDDVIPLAVATERCASCSFILVTTPFTDHTIHQLQFTVQLILVFSELWWPSPERTSAHFYRVPIYSPFSVPLFPSAQGSLSLLPVSVHLPFPDVTGKQNETACGPVFLASSTQ